MPVRARKEMDYEVPQEPAGMRDLIRDYDGSWDRNPHGIVLGKAFSNVQQAIEFAMEPDWNNAKSEKLKNLMKAHVKLGTPTYYANTATEDSSMGGSDVVNSLYQFCSDDDIVHPMDMVEKNLPLDADGFPDGYPSTPCPVGFGRVYKETYVGNQKILWLRFGVPKFNSLSDFYVKAVDGDLSNLMNNGEAGIAKNILTMLGSAIGTTVRLAITAPFLPIYGLNWLIDQAEDVTSTKYFSFRPQQKLYYRMVTSLLAQLSGFMGLHNSMFDLRKFRSNELKTIYGDQLVGSNTTYFKEGPDIVAILYKRMDRVNKAISTGPTKQVNIDTWQGIATDEVTKASPKRFGVGKVATDNGFGEFVSSATAAATGAIDYVGFRIEKGTGYTETISSQTGPSSLAGKLNSQSSAGREASFNVRGLGDEGALGALASWANSTFSSFMDGMGLASPTEVLKGNAHYSIPDTWKSSSFSKSTSLTIQLRARLADPISIYQSVYIPLCMLIAGAAPRSVGKNVYTSPFLVEAFSRGMVSIPLGIIESISITRGLPEYGWTHSHLPTAIDIQISIKDLSPAYYISLASSVSDVLFNDNNEMHNYLFTLAGMSLTDKTYAMQRIGNKLSTAFEMIDQTWFNPQWIGGELGLSRIGRALGSAFPWSTPTR